MAVGSTAPRVAKGGKGIYGAPLGILMLDARLPRIPGDVGNAATGRSRLVPRRARRGRPAAGLHRGGARPCRPRHRGADHQSRVSVPIPGRARGGGGCPGRDLGADAGARGAGHAAAGPARRPADGERVDAHAGPPQRRRRARPLARIGTEGGREFFRVIIAQEKPDVAVAERDLAEAGRTLVARHPEVGAIVLECTNMPPYAAALREALRLPIFDSTTMIGWFHAGLRRRSFG